MAINRDKLARALCISRGLDPDKNVPINDHGMIGSQMHAQWVRREVQSFLVLGAAIGMVYFDPRDKAIMRLTPEDLAP